MVKIGRRFTPFHDPQSTIHHRLFLAVLALLCLSITGCQHLSEVMSGNTPERNDAMLEDPSNADNRRVGLLYFTDHDYGRRAPYTTRYQEIATNDPDVLVRATAIRSLNRSRDVSATGVFVHALADTSPLVRLEAAKALYRLPDDKAVEPLMAMLNKPDETRDDRIAAAEALQHYRRFDVGRSLVGVLNQRDFGVAWQARRSLKRMTGQDLNYDESAWLEFLSGPTKPLG